MAKENEMILQRLDGIDEQLKRFDGIDERLDGIDKRLDGVDERLDGIDKRLDGVDERFDEIDGELKRLDEKIDTVNENLTSEIHRLDEKIDTVAFGVTKINLTLENDILPRLIAIGDGYSQLFEMREDQQSFNKKSKSDRETLFLRVGKAERDISDIQQQLA